MQRFFSSSLLHNFLDAFNYSAILGLFPSLFFYEIMKWYTINVAYVNIALGVIALDHLLGSYVHRFVKDDFDWKKNITGFGVKVSMVVAFGFIMEGLSHVTIEDDFIYRYIKMSGRILVILYPGISAMKNIKIITKGVFPPDAIIGKLENFNKDLDVEKLKGGNRDAN
jgi:hypothetical protein